MLTSLCTRTNPNILTIILISPASLGRCFGILSQLFVFLWYGIINYKNFRKMNGS